MGRKKKQLSTTARPRIGGKTALHCAVAGGHIETMVVLLEAGASPNSIDNFGISPLYLASFLGNNGAVLELLKHGASVNDNSLEVTMTSEDWDRYFQM